VSGKAKLFDDIGAASMRDLQSERHIGYRFVASRLRDELQRLRDLLETDLDAVATAKLRGQIAATKVALDMPRKILDEYRKAGGE
jgi:hypothetical protein